MAITAADGIAGAEYLSSAQKGVSCIGDMVHSTDDDVKIV